jgi:hypothetical protein
VSGVRSFWDEPRRMGLVIPDLAPSGRDSGHYLMLEECLAQPWVDALIDQDTHSMSWSFASSRNRTA